MHETLALGHSTRKATYAAILWDDITEVECETMTCHLCSEADTMWKKMHEVMYNHQLEYDRRLTNFLKEVEMTLANIRDQIWTTVHALTESEGVTFEDCLNLRLCILLLLPQICKEVRASWTLTKVLGGVHHQESEGVDCVPSPTVSEGSVGLSGL